MSDIAIVVHNNGKYEDGDPLVIMNDRLIKQVHAEHICHPNNFGLSVNKLRPSNTLADYYLGEVYEFKFQRIEQTKVLRTNLVNGEQDILSNIPNAKKEYIHIKEFIEHQLRFPNHNIFGEKGAEYWYGGNYKPTKEKIAKVWIEIEKRTTRKEKDHEQWPFSHIEKKEYLLISTGDMDDAEVGEFLSQHRDQSGELLKQRKYKIAWRDFISDVDKVLDNKQESDFRAEKKQKNILKIK